MGEDKKNDLGLLEKLAIIADSLQVLYNSKTIVVFELNEKDYKTAISHFREIDHNHNKFTIDISGTDFVFTKNIENLTN